MTDVQPTNPFQAPQPKSQLENVSRESGFQVPVETVTLPSRGLVYPPDHPFCNSENVEIKCMTAKEEDLLTSRSLIKNGTVISKLLESCILNKAVNAGSLLSGDRTALLIAIRVTGYGGTYESKVLCSECDEEFEHSFNLGALKIKGLSAQPVQPNTNLFNYTLPISGKRVEFKLLTGNDDLEISQIAERKRKLGSVENAVTTRMFQSIVSIDGETDRQKIAYAINNMPAGDSRALRKYIDQIEPEVEMKQWARCPHCSEESEVSVPLGLTFFWPDAGK